MAEGWMRHLVGDNLEVISAGIEAHGKNPSAISVMSEIAIDISNQTSTKLTPDMLDWADLVVTVCGHADEHCPVLPAGTNKEHWPLDDPAKVIGNEEKIMNAFYDIRDDIGNRVRNLIGRLKSKYGIAK